MDLQKNANLYFVAQQKIPEKQIHELLYNDKYDQLINNILTNVFPKLDAIDGTGSGGGASGSTNSENLSTPGRGGSGIVVIRYLIA